MLTRAASCEVVERLVSASTLADGHQLLARAIARFDLAHFSYLGLPSAVPAGEPTVVTSYSRAWQDRYRARDYIHLDPVVAAGLAGVRPYDWGGLDRRAPERRAFFAEARDFAVGACGMSFPIHAPSGAMGLLSLNTDMPHPSWRRLQVDLVADFAIIAYTFHGFAARLAEASCAPRRPLSARERECLAWSAAGKGIWDISGILSVSERTVRAHLLNARAKLDAVNTTQAVARAVQAGLIDLP